MSTFSGEDRSAEITVKATVTAIDPKTRVITLRSPDGEISKITAGAAVRNFNQIKVGDLVSIGYTMSVAFETREPTAAELSRDNAIVGKSTRAMPGQKPGAAIAAQQIKVVTIAAVDKDNQLVTFKDAAGVASTVKAKYPENLKLVKEGDRVVLTLSEAVAASVTPIN